MKIHITFYKYILNISIENNAQQNYLSIEPLLNFLAAFFAEKTRFLSEYFSNSESGIRVYTSFFEAKIEGILFYTFLKISPRKINIFKKTKLVPRDLKEMDDMNVKKNAAQYKNYFEIYYKESKKCS